MMEKGCTKIDADEMTSASSFLAAMGSWEKLVSTHAKYADLVLWSNPDFYHWSRFLFSMDPLITKGNFLHLYVELY